VHYEAANVIAIRLAANIGMRKAKVTLGRKLAVVLHRMLVDSTAFVRLSLDDGGGSEATTPQTIMRLSCSANGSIAMLSASSCSPVARISRMPNDLSAFANYALPLIDLRDG
jgi:hypothetical protein